MRVGFITALLAAVWACNSSGTVDRERTAASEYSETPTVQGVLTGELPDSARVIQTTSEDRIYLVEDTIGQRLVWEGRVDERWKEIWRSRPLYGANPEARLEDFNVDGATDLFWTIDFDEFIGGMLVLRQGLRAVELHPGVEECEVPRIEKVGSSFQLTIHTPGVYTAEECVEPVVRLCVSKIPASWPRFFVIDGYEMREVRRNSQYYQELAAKYRAAASDLETLISSGANLPDSRTLAAYCGEDTPQRLLNLAIRADEISR